MKASWKKKKEIYCLLPLPFSQWSAKQMIKTRMETFIYPRIMHVFSPAHFPPLLKMPLESISNLPPVPHSRDENDFFKT